MRMPQVSPPPTNVEPSNDFRKVLAAAQKIKRKTGDSYLGVDTLLLALVEASKDVAEALNEAGKLQKPSCQPYWKAHLRPQFMTC